MKRPAPKLHAVESGYGLRIGREGPPGNKDFILPVDTVTATLGIVGQKGSGKTHSGTVLLEEMLEKNLPVVVIDPMSVFYGVRSSPDGKHPGYPILIFGGEFGDVQITPGMGKAVAQWIVDERRPVILDLTWSTELMCKFVADFAEALYVLNQGQKNGRPLHIIMDEADIFAPQVTSNTEEKRSRDAIDQIVRRGRRRGLGMTMITQRPAVIAKDVLTQIAVFSIFRLVAPQDRDAVMRWIDGGGELQRNIVKNSLGSLNTGTAWVWSPFWLKSLKKIAIRDKTTFDSGRTPAVGEEPHGPLCMAELDAGDAEERLAEGAEESDGASPKELRERIAFLEEQLAQAGIDTGPSKNAERKKVRRKGTKLP